MDVTRRLPLREVAITTPSHQALARSLITLERGADETPRAASTAAGRVFDKLSRRLAELITRVGAEALLDRAVHLARAEFPFLSGVRSALGANSVIDKLRETADTVDPSEAENGLVSVLGTLVALLESFIGEDLTYRLLREVWPQLAMTGNSPMDGATVQVKP
jgi:hypothetical protein